MEQTGEKLLKLNVEYQNKCEKHNELDKELDEYAKVIEEKIHEIAQLEDRVYQAEYDLSMTRKQLKTLEDTIISKNQIISNNQTRLRELEKINENLEDKMRNNKCKCCSPVYEKRRQSRNELFDRQRSLKLQDEENILKDKVHELELDLVSKNAKIVTLQLQIQSQNFPFETKCKDLENHIRGLTKLVSFA